MDAYYSDRARFADFGALAQARRRRNSRFFKQRKIDSRRWSKAIGLALERLLADDLTYTHSSALFESKAEFIKSVTGGTIDYVSIVPSEADWKVRVNGNTAIVNGVAAVNVIDTGKDLKIKIRYTTVHTNRDGQWQMQAWQATRFPAIAKNGIGCNLEARKI